MVANTVETMELFCWTVLVQLIFSARGLVEITSPEIQPVVHQIPGALELQCRDTDCGSIAWFKDNQKIDSSAASGILITSHIENDGGGCTLYSELLISESKLEDSGTYSCRQGDDRTTEYNVTVKTLEISGNNVTANIGSSAALHCSPSGIDGYKPIYWYRNGNESIQADRIKYTIYNQNDTLIIHDSDISDSGQYSCKINIGSQTYQTDLDLKVKDENDEDKDEDKDINKSLQILGLHPVVLALISLCLVVFVV